MTNTITLTDEQMKALQSGQAITIEPPKPVITKWEPKGGDYCILKDFSVTLVNNNCTYPKHMTYETQKQAEQASKAIRAYARQLKWLSENSDGWEADWNSKGQEKYYITFCKEDSMYKKLHVVYIKSINTIYMSKDNAEKLTRLLNKGVVKF